MSAAVIDASALTELVLATAKGARVSAHIAAQDLDRHIPDHCAIETSSALRGLVRGGAVPDRRAAQCVGDLASFPAERHRGERLLVRAWALRHNLTIYDALYVALAESLDAVLLTCDDKLDTPVVRRLIDVEVIR